MIPDRKSEFRLKDETRNSNEAVTDEALSNRFDYTVLAIAHQVVRFPHVRGDVRLEPTVSFSVLVSLALKGATQSARPTQQDPSGSIRGAQTRTERDR